MAIIDELAKLSPEAQQAIGATLRAGQLMETLLRDADAARAILPLADKAAKKVNPAHVTVEEQAAPIVERVLATVDEKLSKRDRDAAEDRAKVEMQRAIDAAKADGFTDEGLAGVLEIMKGGVANFDDAKTLYLARNPRHDATPPGSGDRMDWNAYEEMASGDLKSFFDGSATKSPGITADPERWQRAAALKYLNNEISLPTG